MATLRLLEDYRGIDALTGREISGEAHLRQSLGDILGTLVGTRVMDRDYGAGVGGRLGAPLNASTIADLVADTAEAVRKWEPRVTLKRVAVRSETADTGAAGRAVLDLVVEVAGRTLLLEGVA